MVQLQFKGKAFVQNHHLLVKYHELIPVKEKSLNDKVSLNDNLIIHGDNLKALKALLPLYAGKIKCIYIDPPYNTGNERWAYNDNVSSPMMQEWLNKVVDREDLTRHDKWLCMMTPRLKLLGELLREDGVIFISIDDNELPNLLCLLNGIFGEENHIATFVWVKKKKGSHLSKTHRSMTEYVVAFARSSNMPEMFGEEAYSDKWQPLAKRTNAHKELSFPASTVTTSLKDGHYGSGAYGKGTSGIELMSSIQVSHGRIIRQFRVKGPFVWGQRKLDEELRAGTRVSLSSKFGLNVFRHDQSGKIKRPTTLLDEKAKVGTNEDATSELLALFGIEGVMDYPKPSSLPMYLVRAITHFDLDAVVLDSFAGTGTTAHAVLQLNKEDGGNRRFILVECEDYADSITAERVRRVIKGVPTAKDEALRDGLGGTFSYFELGRPVEIESMLDGSNLPTYRELARYVFYTATGDEFNDAAIDPKTHFIGESRNYQVYLFYQPNVAKLKNTALTLDIAKSLPPLKHDKRRLIFAPTKYLDQHFLDEFRIDFAQLPFEIYRLVR